MAIIIIAFLFFWQAPQGPGRMEGIGADSGYGNGPVTGALPVIPPGREGEGDQGDDEPGILFGTEDEKSRGDEEPGKLAAAEGESDQESEDAGDEGYELADPVEYAIIENTAYRIYNGKKEKIERVEVRPTGKSGRQYFIFETSNPHRLSWEEPGAYLFDAGGKFLFILPIGHGDISGRITFSPNEKYVAEEESTWVVGDWHIFTFPDLQKMGTIRAYESIVWEDDDYIIFTALAPTEKPNSPLDLSDYRYIAAYDIKNGKEIPILMWDDLTEYDLGRQESNDYLVVVKIYVEKIEDWADYELWKREEIRIPNPVREWIESN